MASYLLRASDTDRCTVMVIGDVMLDHFVYGSIDRISPEAPIPVLTCERTRSMGGGAANVALNIASLGGRALLIGLVGDDAEGATLRETLGDLSASLAPLLVNVPGRPTTVKTRFIAQGQQMLRVDREIRAPVTPDIEDQVLAHVQHRVAECAAVAVSDYGKGMLTDRIVTGVIAAAKQAGVPIVVDPKRTDFSIYSGSTYIKPNAKELSQATGMPCNTDQEVALAAQRVMERIGSSVLLTRSEKGMSLFCLGATPVHVRSVVREVYDVSGAGDTALAAFALALGRGETADSAARLANSAASVAIAKRGTAVVTAAELDDLLSDPSRTGPRERIVSAERAVLACRSWKDRGLRVGFTNGCFDILHAGHISLLTKAAATCDRLVVALNSDSSVRRLKGPGRPAQSEETRTQVMAAVGAVDLVTIFDADTPLAFIEAIKPDVLIKGADYAIDQVVGADIVQAAGGRVVLIDLVDNVSTTQTIRRVQKATDGRTDT